MIHSETWKIALEALRANKMKAFLTMLGVVIGSGCIVLVVTVALGGKQYIIGQIEAVGSNMVSARLQRSGPQQAVALSDEISADDMEAVRENPLVVDVAGSRQLPMTVVVEGVERPVNLVGVTEGFQRIRNLVIPSGRFFDADDMMARNKYCLLTEDLARIVFPSENPVGRTIRVGELTFTVIGVFRERVATFGLSEITRESLIVPLPLLEYYTGQDFIRTLYAQARRPEDVEALTRQVDEILKSRHRAGAVYLVENLTAILEAARNISFALTVVLLLIAFIALVISGIGIMNIQLVTVTQRTREIGIRKAIGAQRREILYQFLFEAFLISGTGALLGILIAVSIPALARIVLPLIPGVDANIARIPISWLSVVVAFVVSSLTGVVFGYLPARRAAKLQPTESLRYE